MDYRVIKENDLFLMTEKSGDIPKGQSAGHGLYTKDTRFLSRLETELNGKKLILLSSPADDHDVLTFRLTNPHMEQDGNLLLWRESVEVIRKRFIYQGVLYETCRLTNYYPKAVTFEFSVMFDADFADMFVVRGYHGGKTGDRIPTVHEPCSFTLGYLGADGLKRTTKIQWDSQEARRSKDGKVDFTLTLHPKEYKEISFFVSPGIGGESKPIIPKEEALAKLTEGAAAWNSECTEAATDVPLFNSLWERGKQDLRVLLTDVGYGMFPVAGLPWFAVPFGRDSLIAALQMLSLNPEIAKGTLLTMAAFQGTQEDEWRDEQPGKIMHELRSGELAATKAIPFTPYYGTVDATPLFLLLAAEYYHWTADEELIHRLLPNLKNALAWIERFGDEDQDQFVEYYQKSSKGIANQGWKDSGDSIVHANGDYARAPIALSEVQGYVYQAKTRLAPILRKMGHLEWAEELEQSTKVLQVRFNREFWMEEEQYYAIALDREKRQVRSVTSNPGHLLMSGILPPERADAVAKRLTAPDLFSGYGIRTMSTGSAGYNPMSYHNGSVWPHDNSLCLMGLSSSGYAEESRMVMDGLMQAAVHFEAHRLPELFCGYEAGLNYPVPYPVACSPQAWAAATPVVFLQALLGIRPDAMERTISLRPMLLTGMNELIVNGIKAGKGSLSLRITREGDGSSPKTEILSNTTGFAVSFPEMLSAVSYK
ncbi:amylo-alpha-1,6-glucosidase [Paenibacillus gansuensis]|uniref:Glycogen debranching N-terminal domain-containing protein n=1 Tax=Paenibacillus gansuensis TaxID=306542 RepID=A0ABW5PE86_9BACL